MTTTDTQPTPGTITYRRELRATVRNTLGVNRADPPVLKAVLRAAQALSTLLKETTSGRYALRVINVRTGEARMPGDVLAEVLASERRG
jgi:hypothetical protein